MVEADTTVQKYYSADTGSTSTATRSCCAPATAGPSPDPARVTTDAAEFEEALARYAFTCCEVWVERGFGDTCAATIAADLAEHGITTVRSQTELAETGALPPWLGDPEFHRSHQSSLLRKDPEHYGPLFPGVPDDLDYVWPVRRSA